MHRCSPVLILWQAQLSKLAREGSGDIVDEMLRSPQDGGFWRFSVGVVGGYVDGQRRSTSRAVIPRCLWKVIMEIGASCPLEPCKNTS